MKTTVKFLFGAAALSAAVGAMAQAKAPEPDYTISYNVGAVSDYRFRGITQTNFGPALQGGIDFAHKNGLYLGAWASPVSWVKQFNGASKGDWELDLYGGYKFEVAKDLTLDVGFITYQYPGNDSGEAGTPGAGTVTNANTTEVYVGVTYGMFTFKYNHSTGNFLGFLNSSGSNYIDLSANFDLGNGFSLTPHVGKQTVRGQAGNAGDYTDYALTLGKDLGNGLSASLAWYGTNIAGGSPSETFYTNTNGNTNFIGRSGAAFGIKYSF